MTYRRRQVMYVNSLVRQLQRSMYGTVEDLRALQGIIGLEEFWEVLDHAPPGIFDARSWAYWNLKCEREPASGDFSKRISLVYRDCNELRGSSPAGHSCVGRNPFPGAALDSRMRGNDSKRN